MNVLHVATLNRPIRQALGYGPIETVVYNIGKGLHTLGHLSILACSGDSGVVGEQYTTIEKSSSECWSQNTRLEQKHMRRHLVMSLQWAQKDDVDIIHLHDTVIAD